MVPRAKKSEPLRWAQKVYEQSCLMSTKFVNIHEVPCPCSELLPNLQSFT